MVELFGALVKPGGVSWSLALPAFWPFRFPGIGIVIAALRDCSDNGRCNVPLLYSFISVAASEIFDRYRSGKLNSNGVLTLGGILWLSGISGEY